MGDKKKGKGKQAKSTKVGKKEKADKKRTLAESIRESKNRKKVLNKKRHRGSHTKGTRKKG